MDKVEYKIRADEIKALIGEGRYAEAVKIADTIDWKKVRSVSMLCTISDLYKINRRFEESRDVLLMAYERHPTGRAIVYSLCGLAIKMDEIVQALEYYKEFVRIAPRDTGRYILQYKLYEAQDVSLEERIAVLEELKKHDYTERWAYELAYLYHRVGLTTECVEECDEMFLWFGEGRYVMKALELKALHEPLSPEQQDRYNRYKQKTRGTIDASIVSEQDEMGRDEEQANKVKQPTKEMPPITDEVIRAYNAGEPIPEPPVTQVLPDTAEMEAAIENPYQQQEPYQQDVPYQQEESYQSEESYQQEEPYQQEASVGEIVYPHINEIKEPSVDVSDYNTQNLQEALKEGLREIIGEDENGPELSVTPDTGAMKQPTGEMQELFFETQTVEIPTAPSMGIDIKYGGNGPILGEAKEEPVSQEPYYEEETAADQDYELPEEEPQEDEQISMFSEPAAQKPAFGAFEYEEKPLEDEVPGAVIHPNASYQMPSHFESILSQEYDGQISMAVQPEPEVEKQITGQISIAEYMENWEQYKKEQQEKQLQKVKQRVADETGDMFADFDQQSRVGLQEKIEKAISDAIKQERHDKASGRGDWSVKREDVINAAVAKVMETENLEPVYEAVNEALGDSAEDEDVQDFREVIDDDDKFYESEKRHSYNEETGRLYTVEKIESAIEETVPEDDTEYIREEIKVEEPEVSKTERIDPVPEATEQKQEISEETEAPSIDSEKAEEKAPEENSEEAQHASDEEEEEKPSEAEKSEKPEDKPSPKKKDKKPHHIGNREIEERVRTMTPEEKELFGPYIHHKKSRRQIINAIDNLSMDAFTGNAIVTGEEGAGTVNLAKGLIKAVQASDSNFSGKVAKITANTLNKKSTSSIFERLANGALIIQRAADLEPETVNELLKILQEENKGLILVMEDTRDDMDKFLDRNPSLRQSFNVRVDIEALDDDSLVAYAKQYAYEKEYAIDNLGILALHTRISERQTLDHEVTVAEVKDIIDDAIYYAEKRNLAHFVDVIVNKRYDENDMIILREKDFMH